MSRSSSHHPPEHGGDGIPFPGSSVPGDPACASCPAAQYALRLERRSYQDGLRRIHAARALDLATAALEALPMGMLVAQALAALRLAHEDLI